MQLSLTSALYLAGFIQSAYLLLTIPSHRGRPLLLLFLSAVALLTANYVVWENAWLSPSAQFWTNRFTHTSLTYVLGPSLYLYFRLNATPEFELRPSHLWHYLPYGLMLLVSIFIFPRYLPLWATYTENWCLKATTWPQILRGFHILVYAWLGGRLLWIRASEQPSDSFRNALTGAIILTGGVGMMVSTAMYLVSDMTVWKARGEVVAVLCSVGMLYLLNRLLSEYRPNAISLSPVIAAHLPAKPIVSPVKYQHSGLDPATASVLFGKFDAYLLKSRAYEDPEITLAQLAQALNVPANQLSQAINQAGGQTFYESINRHRVTAACHLLTDPKQEHLSVSGIGYEVGFRSKSTYYAAFRRERGITPNAYRRQNGHNRPPAL